MIDGILFLQLCKKHHFGIDKPEKLVQSPEDSKFLIKTFSQIKSNVAVPIKKKVGLFVFSRTFPSSCLLFSLPPETHGSSSSFSSAPTQYPPAFQAKENKEKERLERRLLEELYKIFMDSDSFYYSLTYDLTNSVQRQGDSDRSGLPLWKQVGSRTDVYLLYVWKCLLTFDCPSAEKVDDRFFWNKHMIQDVIDLQVEIHTRRILLCER